MKNFCIRFILMCHAPTLFVMEIMKYYLNIIIINELMGKKEHYYYGALMPQLKAVWIFLFTIINLRVVRLELNSLRCKKRLPVWGGGIETDRHKLRVTALGNKPGMYTQWSLSEMLHCWATLKRVIELQRLTGLKRDLLCGVQRCRSWGPGGAQERKTTK